jgi:DNA-binding response OmpR family regulator
MSPPRKIVLVVDADEAYGRALHDTLTAADADVMVTRGVETALQFLDEVPIVDLVVLSTNLPNGGARRLLESIKLDPATVDTAVLCLVAGAPGASEIERLTDLGAEAVIERSDDVDEIAYRVQSRLYPQHRDRRGAPRASVRVPAVFMARREAFQGVVRDISVTGAFVHTDFLLEPDTDVLLDFVLPRAARRIRCAARVARVVVGGEQGAARLPGSGIGVVFTSMEPADSRLIRGFVEQSLYADAGAGADRLLPL